MKRKQSREDRLRRLENGCCPIHGIPMHQVGLTSQGDEDDVLYIAECDRKDCNIRGTTDEPFGPLTLLPEFRHLLDGEA
jgi:hypothetical protein